jgi:hypothetical protein
MKQLTPQLFNKYVFILTIVSIFVVSSYTFAQSNSEIGLIKEMDNLKQEIKELKEENTIIKELIDIKIHNLEENIIEALEVMEDSINTNTADEETLERRIDCITNNLGVITILDAWYGHPINKNRRRDVKSILINSKVIKMGNKEIGNCNGKIKCEYPVENRYLGGDIAIGVVKMLEVKWRCGLNKESKVHTGSAMEHKTIQIKCNICE